MNCHIIFVEISLFIEEFEDSVEYERAKWAIQIEVDSLIVPAHP